MSGVLDTTITGSSTDRGMYSMILSLSALAGGVYTINTILSGNLSDEKKRNVLAYVFTLSIFAIVTAFFTNIQLIDGKIHVNGIPEYTKRDHWLHKSDAETNDGVSVKTDGFSYTFLQRNVIHILISMALAYVSTKHVIKRLK